jgi:CPA2 family monovalent cation:H+ antiporter-2
LAVVLMVAAATAVICNRARQPVVLGYLLAGIIVGPHTPPFSFIQDQATIETLGELGVVFLLFGLGLHFDLRKLRAVGTTALVAGTLQILIMIWIGFVVGQLFGLSSTDSIFLGAIISISSTVIIVKIVSEFGQQEEKWAQIAFGILIIEDIIAVCILAVLSQTGGLQPAALNWYDLALVLGKVGLFIASALVLGLLLVPRAVSYLAKLPVEEVLLVGALGLAAGLAMLGTALGFSPALGAFIMGAIIAASKEAAAVERRVRPVRDMFSAIFFVSVGMLFDPGLLVTHWPLIVAVTAAVIVGKVAAVSFAVFITGHEPRTSLRTGFSLAQVGEFSFIIAALGVTLGVTVAPLFEVAVSVDAITAFTTPLLIRSSPRVADFAAARAPRSLVTFARLYDTWVAQLRRPVRSDPGRARTGRHLGRAALAGAVLTEILILGSGAFPAVVGWLSALVPGIASVAPTLAWTLIALAALPFGYLFLASLRHLARSLAEAAEPQAGARTEHQRVIRALLESTFMLAGVLALGAAVLSLASPFVPALPLAVATLVALVVGGAVFYRRLTRFQSTIDGVLEHALGGHGAAAETLSEAGVLPALQEKYPWGLEQRVVKLRAGSWAADRTLASTRLRTLTGATVLDIERASAKVLNPPPGELLEEGDHVVLIGEKAHLDAGERLLLDGPATPLPPEDPATVGEISVLESSPFAGTTLGALHLRERTGLTVLGVVRGARQIKDPSADLALEAGDVLVAIGTLAQLEEGRRQALSRGQDPAPVPPA